LRVGNLKAAEHLLSSGSHLRRRLSTGHVSLSWLKPRSYCPKKASLCWKLRVGWRLLDVPSIQRMREVERRSAMPYSMTTTTLRSCLYHPELTCIIATYITGGRWITFLSKRPGADGKVEALDCLLSSTQGLHLNCQDLQGKSALPSSCEKSSDAGWIEILLERGADPNMQDHLSNTALHAASSRHTLCPNIIEVLLSHGANLNVLNRLGNPALHLVCADEDGGMRRGGVCR
jgi:hypothetical protein